MDNVEKTITKKRILVVPTAGAAYSDISRDCALLAIQENCEVVFSNFGILHVVSAEKMLDTITASSHTEEDV